MSQGTAAEGFNYGYRRQPNEGQPLNQSYMYQPGAGQMAQQPHPQQAGSAASSQSNFRPFSGEGNRLGN